MIKCLLLSIASIAILYYLPFKVWTIEDLQYIAASILDLITLITEGKL